MRASRRVLCLIAATAALASAAASPRAEASQMIPRALGIFITERGQQYFAEKMPDFLERNGISLDQGGFQDWSYEAQDPLVLDNLPVQYQSYHETLGAVRDILKSWLRGFDFQDPKFKAEVKDISYSAQFSHMGIRVSPEASRDQCNGQGAVLLVEVEIPSVRIEAATVRGNDLNNPFLDTFGVDQLWTSLAQGSEPLRIQIPVMVQLTRAGTVDFRVMSLDSNLSEVRMDMGMHRPMLLPSVHVTVNGHRMTLNQTRVEDRLLEYKEQLLEVLQKYLNEFAQNQVPAALNNLIAAHVPNPFSDVNEMDPPGASQVGPGDKYRWGVRPEEIRVTPQYLHFGLSAFVDDPRVPNDRQVVSRRLTNSLPSLNLVDPSTYDVALTVNEDLVNRVLGLSFRRRYFDNIVLDDGTNLKIVAAPEFRFDATSARDRGKLHLKVQSEVSGLQTIAVRNPLEFEIDVDAHLVHSPSGDVSVNMSSIELNDHSPYINPDSIRMFSGMVYSGLRDKLQHANQTLAQHEKELVKKLPIPTQVVGVPIKVKDFQSDRNGYLVIYLEYDVRR